MCSHRGSRRYPCALWSPKVGIGRRMPPLKLLHLRAAKIIFWVFTVVSRFMVRIGARRGLQHLMQQVIAELGLLSHPFVVPVGRRGAMPGLPRSVSRPAFLVELVRTLHRPGAPLASSPLASSPLAPAPASGLLPGHFVLSFSRFECINLPDQLPDYAHAL